MKIKTIILGSAILSAACSCFAMDKSADQMQKLTVLKNGPKIYVRSYFSPEKDIVINLSNSGTNGQTNFGYAGLVPCNLPSDTNSFEKVPVFHACGDDSTPWNLNGTYIGGNHGSSDVIEITSENHGFMVKDIGSAWTDEAGKTFYIIRIPKPNIIQLLSENEGKDGIWKFTRSIKGKEIKRVSDGKALNVQAAKLTQLWPSCRINKQEYLLNGKDPLVPGEPAVCDYFDIVEEYDIIAPDSLLDVIKKNPGKEPQFTAKELDSVVTNHIVYRFQPMGACTVEHRSTARRNFNLGYMGFIQSASLTRGAFDTHEYYIPKTLPFELNGRSYNFANFEDYSQKLPNRLPFGAKYNNISDTKNPPDRFIQFLGEKKGGEPIRKIGYVLGYSLIEGITRPAERSVNCKTPVSLFFTNTTYPRAIEDGTVEAGKEFYCLAYRQYFDASAHKNATSVFWHKEADSYLIYIDYHKSVEKDTIKLPALMAGRKITIVEQTPSLKLLMDIKKPADELVMSVGKEAYGYIVLKLD